MKSSLLFRIRTFSSWTPYQSAVWLEGVMRRKPTKVKMNRVDGVRQRVSLASGKVIPKPQESMQRSHPASTAIGPKDTLPSDVVAVLWSEL